MSSPFAAHQDLLDKRLDALTATNASHGLGHLVRGIEKESLRVQPDGRLATTAHPRALGSALTNAHITTDYSEALVELVTPVFTGANDVLDYLRDLQSYVYQHLDEELLWCTSMPCIVPDDDAIPVANYGSSNVGMMKHVYRLGLGHRYGRTMQTIAGLHYNVSLPRDFWSLAEDLDLFDDNNNKHSDPISANYFSLVRNVHRHGWLLFYLFGASPAVCKSFLQGRDHGLDELDSGTVFKPFATSLRMSRLGYQNNAQDSLDICVNDLKSYAESLIKATQSLHGPYEKIGVEVDGVWKQLNASILQIENEYYAPVRPKRVANSGEKPSRALLDRGVEYVEIRTMDLDPFSPAGISSEAIHFLDVFTVYCLLEESDLISKTDQAMFSENQSRVVMHGRDPTTRIATAHGEHPLATLATNILHRMLDIAELMDADNDGQSEYVRAVHNQLARVKEPELTLSARVLSTISDTGEGFSEMALRLSREHADNERQRVLARGRAQEFDRQAAESLQAQARLEQDDTLSFRDYLREYFAR